MLIAIVDLQGISSTAMSIDATTDVVARVFVEHDEAVFFALLLRHVKVKDCDL